MEYKSPNEGRKGKLCLDFNENLSGCSAEVIEAISKLGKDDVARYPEYDLLYSKMADYLGISSNEIVMTNGTDEAIKIVMDSFCQDGELLIASPSFTMFNVLAEQANGKVKEVMYNQDLSFPVEEFINAIDKKTKVVAIVNPNNPTGSVVGQEEIIRIVEKAKDAVVVIDEAYFEFYGKSSIGLIRKYPNIVVTRTFSKAFGMAGLRLGCLVADSSLIRKMKLSPFSVNCFAAAAGIACLDNLDYVKDYVAEVRKSKKCLVAGLREMGIKYYPSDANFVLADFGRRANYILKSLATKGILVRDRSSMPMLKGCIRITVGNLKDSEKIISELQEILNRRFLLFDMDGVLADVRESYREAIRVTAEFFINGNVTMDEIQSVKEEGGFNNDWKLTQEVIQRKGIIAEFSKVKDKFQEFYLGGLRDKERLVMDKEILSDLGKEYILGIVTGRPREEAEYFLLRNGIKDFFQDIICLEDVEGREKPDPFGILLALKGAKNAIYFGDSVDDMEAAVRAGITGIGIVPSGFDDNDILKSKGTEKVIRINEIMEALK